mgnify:CR=1 FL=1
MLFRSVDEAMCRHMVLNSIKSFRNKYKKDYGELVIACDNRNYWRKQIFPYYKANRKKNIERSELNWKDIFDCLNKIKSELKEYFPYRIIEIEHAEADDVIAVLSHTYSRREKILIMSGDKDFQQLQRFSNVFQYDPVRKKQIVNSDPITFLKEHIIRGDPGDGIPQERRAKHDAKAERQPAGEGDQVSVTEQRIRGEGVGSHAASI